MTEAPLINPPVGQYEATNAQTGLDQSEGLTKPKAQERGKQVVSVAKRAPGRQVATELADSIIKIQRIVQNPKQDVIFF